jgi:hypothetical protein
MAKQDAKPDRFDEVCAELNNSAMAVYGTGCYLAREYAPEMLDGLQRELERYRRLVAELREIHRAGLSE